MAMQNPSPTFARQTNTWWNNLSHSNLFLLLLVIVKIYTRVSTAIPSSWGPLPVGAHIRFWGHYLIFSLEVVHFSEVCNFLWIYALLNPDWLTFYLGTLLEIWACTLQIVWPSAMPVMVVRIVEFSSGGYKIRNIFS